MKFKYFIPIIFFGPTKDITFIQELPLKGIEKLIIGNFCVFEVIRIVKSAGKVIEEYTSRLEYNSGWKLKEGECFRWLNVNIDNLNYIETQVNVIEGDGVTDNYLPGFYAFYTSNEYKTYLSCSNFKYGNPRTIMQMEEFKLWTEGYPCISINRKLKSTYSVIVINPYVKTASYNLEIRELGINYSFIVKSNSIIKIDIADLIELDEWMGQVYVQGSQRSVLYFINHEVNNFNNVITIEHSDPFRAEKSSVPRLQHLRNKAHKLIKSFKNV